MTSKLLLFFYRREKLDVNVECPEYFVMISPAVQPMEMNLVKKDSNFKFCPIAAAMHQAWRPLAKYDDGTEKKITMDPALKPYSYASAEKIGLY